MTTKVKEEYKSKRNIFHLNLKGEASPEYKSYVDDSLHPIGFDEAKRKVLENLKLMLQEVL